MGVIMSSYAHCHQAEKSISSSAKAIDLESGIDTTSPKCCAPMIWIIGGAVITFVLCLSAGVALACQKRSQPGSVPMEQSCNAIESFECDGETNEPHNIPAKGKDDPTGAKGKKSKGDNFWFRVF